MTFKIASWNIEGRLTNNDISLRSTPDKIIESIKKLNADILILPEAHNEINLKNLKIKQKLKDIGYELFSVPYQEVPVFRLDAFYTNLSLMILSKLPIKKFDIIRPADYRNELMAIIRDPQTNKEVRIIGLHLDDLSEETRIRQVKDLVKIINSSNTPTILLGDLNAMHSEDLWPSKFLRNYLVRNITSKLSVKFGKRAVEMARGEALKLLQSNTNLTDADPRHQPTTTPKIRGIEFMPSIRLMQIDHMFVSPEIKISNFTISPDGGADHRAISAIIDL